MNTSHHWNKFQGQSDRHFTAVSDAACLKGKIWPDFTVSDAAGRRAFSD
jgi:hypothetical protein